MPFSISLPKLCELQSLAQESTNYDYDYESVEYRVTAIILHTSEWAIPESIHTSPVDDTESGTQKFQDFQKGFAGFQSLLIQNLEEFQNFAKI